VSARTWSQSATQEQIGETLAGLHADNIMFVLDESGSMPGAIMKAAEAALSSCVEGHIIQAGNPSMLEGPLYRACTRDRELWWVAEITGDPDNPKRSPRIDPVWARQMIEAHGRDDSWVRVNIFGEFPASSLTGLIGPEEIEAATRRNYSYEDVFNSPRIMGVDVARYGGDLSVVWLRQGLIAKPPKLYRGLNSIEGAGHVAQIWREEGANACFIDDTGGFGAGWIDQLGRLGFDPIGVHFSGQPSEPKFFNKRSEMIFAAVEWIKNGGQLPPMSTQGMEELTQALTETTYTFKNDRIILEDKEQLKKKARPVS
jgi:phage terminase large subunit